MESILIYADPESSDKHTGAGVPHSEPQRHDPLLVAERNHWVNPRRSARRNPARDRSCNSQQQRRRRKRLWIVNIHAHELRTDHSPKGQTDRYPDRDSDSYEPQPTPDNHSENSPAFCS